MNTDNKLLILAECNISRAFIPLFFFDFKFLHIYNTDNTSILNEPFQVSDNITLR